MTTARPVIRLQNQSSLVVIDRTTSRETVPRWHDQSHGRPASRKTTRTTCRTRSCAMIDGANVIEWSHAHVRPSRDFLRFVIAGPEFWTWPSTLLRPNLLVRSPTICPRFICDLSYFWSYIGRNMVASPGRLGPKRTDVWPQDLEKTRSREIRV